MNPQLTHIFCIYILLIILISTILTIFSQLKQPFSINFTCRRFTDAPCNSTWVGVKPREAQVVCWCCCWLLYLFIDLGTAASHDKVVGFVVEVPLVATSWYGVGRCDGTLELARWIIVGFNMLDGKVGVVCNCDHDAYSVPPLIFFYFCFTLWSKAFCLCSATTHYNI